MWNGNKKAITFSYDDGCESDKKIIEILDKYKLKGTFNLNSELLGTTLKIYNPDGVVVEEIPKIKESDVKETYKNHEIAVHTLTHPNLTRVSDEEVIRQVNEDKKNLERISGQKIVGMAYPCGGINNDERVGNLIKKYTQIKYARTITASYNCEIQTDLIHFNPTAHHSEKRLLEIFESFINSDSDKPQILYIWGHAFELDRGTSMSWTQFDDLCRMLSNRKGVYYGTNREVLLGE